MKYYELKILHSLIFLLVFIQANSLEHAIAIETPSRLNSNQIIYYKPWYAPLQINLAAKNISKRRYQPHASVPIWKFQYPIDWRADPFRDNNWASMLNALYLLDPLVLQYQRDHKIHHLKLALKIIRDWYDYHYTQGNNSRWSWYDMSVGIRSTKIAWLYGELRALNIGKRWKLSDKDRNMFVNMARNHIERVLDGTIELRMTNHGLFQIHGLVTLCHIFDIDLPDYCANAKDFIIRKLPDIIASQFDSEGMHKEHSPGYHRFALSTLNFFMNSGLYNNYPYIEGVFNRANKNVFWLVDPSNKLWNIGDTISSTPPSDQLTLFPTFDNCKGSEARQSQDFFRDCVQMKLFQFGYVSVRTAPNIKSELGSGLFVQGAFHSSIHKHLDDLSFILYENGQRIIVDSGFYGYQVSRARRYVQSTRAHNTVEIGHSNFSRDTNLAYGSAILQAEKKYDHYFIAAKVNHKKLSTTHQRNYIYFPGKFLVIRDEVHFKSVPKSLTQWFHLNPNVISLKRKGNRIDLSLKTGNSFIVINKQSCPSTVRKGRTKPRYQGWYSPSDRKLLPNYAVGFICNFQESKSALVKIDTVIIVDSSYLNEGLKFLNNDMK